MNYSFYIIMVYTDIIPYYEAVLIYDIVAFPHLGIWHMPCVFKVFIDHLALTQLIIPTLQLKQLAAWNSDHF